MTIGTSAVKSAPPPQSLALIHRRKNISEPQSKRLIASRLLLGAAALALVVIIGLQLLESRWQQTALGELSARMDAVERLHEDLEQRYCIPLTPPPERAL